VSKRHDFTTQRNAGTTRAFASARFPVPSPHMCSRLPFIPRNHPCLPGVWVPSLSFLVVSAEYLRQDE
jgi:hypothetical protein